jgi:hypothetical protein
MQKEKSKHRHVLHFRKNLNGRNVIKKKNYARKRCSKKSNATGFGSDHFLALNFNPIHVWEVFPDDQKAKIDDLFGNHLKWVIKGIDYFDSNKYVEIYNVLEGIAKETGSEWFFTDVNDQLAVVFYSEIPLDYSWYAIRLNFLPKIKRRSKNMHDVILNSFRIMSRHFAIPDFTDAMYIIEWAEERYCDDGEFETEKDLINYRRLLDNYTTGNARCYLNTVTSSSTMEVEYCITKLKKFPIDLDPIAKPIIDLLELTKKGKSIVDYDLRHGFGFSEIPKDGCSLDVTFNWIWDLDPINDLAEEFLCNEAGCEGINSPVNAWIFSKGFKKPKSIHYLINQIKSDNDDFIPQLSKSIALLCSGINDCFPSKYDN